MERLVNSAADRAVNASVFQAYTAFPGAERQLERHLGRDSKLQLSDRQQAGFVRSAPWCLLAFLPFHALGIAVSLGLLALTALMGHGESMPTAVLGLAGFVLSIVALPGLFRHSRQGWAFLTYSIVVGLVASAVAASLFGTLISAALVWLMFQVKYRYA